MHIKLSNISKKYDVDVLKNISLDIKNYKTVAIIGKSGCGKSTMLRLMTGIESADDGSIVINENIVNKESNRTYQDEISLVFQQHNLFPHLTLLQNITIILEKVRKLPKNEAALIGTNLLTQLHLENEMNKRPRFVSGGQAQRASIARALATNPEIVFMDEPTAALDPVLTTEVLEAVLKLKDSGTRFVFVTHELSFVKEFAEYVVFMDDGHILEEGPVSILKKPQTYQLKRFLNNERSTYAS